MEQHAHLARLRGGAPLPLTLLAQETGTTTEDARRIHDTQAAIGFSTPLMGNQRLASRTTERVIRLKRKVLTREAANFPGQAHLGGAEPERGAVCGESGGAAGANSVERTVSG
jgi:hypothetical protein